MQARSSLGRWWFGFLAVAGVLVALAVAVAPVSGDTFWGCYNCENQDVFAFPFNEECVMAGDNGTGQEHCDQSWQGSAMWGRMVCETTGNACLNTDVYGGGGGTGGGGGGGGGSCSGPPGAWCPAECSSCSTVLY